MFARSPLLPVSSPHIIDESILRKLALQPKSRLALAFPICAVVKSGLRLDLRDCLGVILGHPAIDVIEKRWIVPHVLRLHEMNGERLSDP